MRFCLVYIVTLSNHFSLLAHVVNGLVAHHYLVLEYSTYHAPSVINRALTIFPKGHMHTSVNGTALALCG